MASVPWLTRSLRLHPAESSQVRVWAFPLRLSASAPRTDVHRHPPPPNNSFKPTPCRGIGRVLCATLAHVRRPATGRLNSGVRPQEKNYMKSFFIGCFGALIVLVAAAVINSQYSNYIASSETSRWLAEVTPTTDAISANITRLKATAGSGIGVKKPIFPKKTSLIKITDHGIILLKGGSDGQFIALVPELSNGDIKWHCIGGSSHATRGCRHKL